MWVYCLTTISKLKTIRLKYLYLILDHLIEVFSNMGTCLMRVEDKGRKPKSTFALEIIKYVIKCRKINFSNTKLLLGCLCW